MRAAVQTAGYGRRGRGWQGPKGNLAATLLLPLAEPLGADGPAGYGFAAGLAVRDACIASGASSERLTLKWPNDVLLDGRKLSGLLVELLSGTRQALAIGIGVNLAVAPRVADYETAALAELGPPPKPGAYLHALDTALEARLAKWRTAGFGALREDWLSAARGLGERVAVRLPDETIDGEFSGLSGTGALRLKTASGLREVTVGDVFFPAASR